MRFFNDEKKLVFKMYRNKEKTDSFSLKKALSIWRYRAIILRMKEIEKQEQERVYLIIYLRKNKKDWLTKERMLLSEADLVISTSKLIRSLRLKISKSTQSHF